MGIKNTKNKGFTLIELLVVIAIIALLSTLSVVALNNARQKARNSTRLAGIKEFQTALELFYNDNNGYPKGGTASTTPGNRLVGPTGIVYMAKIPSNPSPRTDGSCPNSEFRYVSTASSTYSVWYCLGEATGGISAGTNCATPAGINDGTGCTPI